MTTLDPRTPILVGVGAVQQREEDPAKALEPVDLMTAALERAAEDAGSRSLLARADAIRAPRGFWDYADPCRIVAERLGAAGARTQLAQPGVLQTALFGGAAEDIARGRADVVLVVGGEAHYRTQRARVAGSEPTMLRQAPGVEPDSVLRPSGELMSPQEIRAGLVMPVAQFAMVENALRVAEGLSVDTHAKRIAELWASMSRVAADNPLAWSPEPVDAATIRAPGGRNRMLAFPYRKLHTSQWNVDQAAGLVFCSVETARALGVPRERWVFPLAVAESNHMTALTRRRALHRCPGFARAGERALARVQCDVDDLEHLELYSCFPAAVRSQLRELGIAEGRPVTITGGMTFAGGPLNNFVLQAQVRMAQVLRADPGSLGLVSAVSGMLAKQGLGLWSTEPRGEGFGFDDVTDAVASEMPLVDVVEEAQGEARVVSYTVLFKGAAPSRSVLLCEIDESLRVLATSGDAGLAETLMREEGCGRSVRLHPDGAVDLL